MLKNSKISQYKIKKILKYFTEDCTSKEASNLMMLNIKTITRYYNIFREVAIQLVVNRLKLNSEAITYIGYIKGVYGAKDYFSIYKVNKKTFLMSKISEKPCNKECAMRDEDFNKYLGFLYKRFGKFYGLTSQGHYHQLFESILRYNYNEEKFFNIIWSQLQIMSKKTIAL